MSDPNEEFKSILEVINEEKATFLEDEQIIIDSWLTKLSELETSDESIRNEYLRTLMKLVKDEKRLLPPFNDMPPEGDLVPLSEPRDKQKISFQIKKLPCPWPKRNQDTGAIPKSKNKKFNRSQGSDAYSHFNEYEDPEEMAKVIARSKGQSFTEFVASIAMHTSDFGQALNQAMKTEICNFKDYVDHVLTQRVKDLTEVLDEEENRELKRIQKDIERWQLELSNVKRRIKEIFPDFDLEEYKRDRNYLKKVFEVDQDGFTTDDSFNNWKEETYHRLKWFSDMACKTSRCNEQTTQSIADINCETFELEALESVKQQNHMKFLNREINEYRKLKVERDSLQKEYLDLLSQIEGNCN